MKAKEIKEFQAYKEALKIVETKKDAMERLGKLQLCGFELKYMPVPAGGIGCIFWQGEKYAVQVTYSSKMKSYAWTILINEDGTK